MPPPQYLNRLILIHALARQRPLPATDLHLASVPREMEFGEEDLRHDVFGGASGGGKAHAKCAASKVEATREEGAAGPDGRGANVGFCGAVAGGGG